MRLSPPERSSPTALDVFDTSKFTVTKTDTLNTRATVDENGRLTAYVAQVDGMDAAGDTQVVENGVFEESTFRSAPYFDVQIDGITLLNSAFKVSELY